VVARELTKMHEELSRGSLADLAREWSGREVRGEIVVVVEGADVREVTAVEVRAAVTAALSSGRSVKDAASDVSTQLGVSRRIAYDAALEISRG
jgi:16S rRNA (cytidine1402-2'-O)-methyltransferase